MPFTLTFPTTAAVPDLDTLEAWLTEQGEPFLRDAPTVVSLRALPLRLVRGADGALHGQVQVEPTTPLSRLVRVAFDLSVHLRADVVLTERATETLGTRVTRPGLWLALADEQDRLRIAAALQAAEQHASRDDVLTAFWTLLGALAPGRDLRWDATAARVMEIREGDERSDDRRDARPAPRYVHTVAWRWLSEAWPHLDRA